jgi:hypothetical protein
LNFLLFWFEVAMDVLVLLNLVHSAWWLAIVFVEKQQACLKLIVPALRKVMLDGKMILSSLRKRLMKKVVMVCFRMLYSLKCSAWFRSVCLSIWINYCMDI